MIRVIALEREFGSGGAAIAQKLATQLGWKLWDQSLTAEVARRAQVAPTAVERCEERVDPLYYRLFKIFMRGSFERSLPVGLEQFDSDLMFELMKNVVEDAADASNCVIVGRGAPYFLRGREDTLRVFIFAPREEKLRRILALGKSEAEAAGLLDTIDKDRATFIKKYHGTDWPCRALYHLMLNSAVGDETVVRLIFAEMEALNQGVAAR